MNIIEILFWILIGLLLIGMILYVFFWIIIGILRVIEIFKGEVNAPIGEYLKRKWKDDL